MENPSSQEFEPDARVRRTPGLLLGPYYPVRAPADAGPRLWRDTATPASARRLTLTGRCRNREGQVLPSVKIELWQADSNGRYPHPSAADAHLALEGFTGYGTAVTDDTGCFCFESLVPGPYQDELTLRAPHLHLQLTGRFDRLVTQIFLPDHPANASDRVLAGASRPDLLLPAVVSASARELHLDWTVVLGRG